MISLTEILVILFIHWFADFVLQTDKQAKGKSKNWSDLLSHTIIYSICWVFLPLILLCFSVENLPQKLLWLIPITFICHTITDYFTSRLNAKLWAKGNVHNFFVSIGFDQYLHYLQLFITYSLLK